MAERQSGACPAGGRELSTLPRGALCGEEEKRPFSERVEDWMGLRVGSGGMEGWDA